MKRKSPSVVVVASLSLVLIGLCSAAAYAHCGRCGIGKATGKKKDGHICETMSEGQLCLQCVAQAMRMSKKEQEALLPHFEAYNAAVTQAKLKLIEAVSGALPAAEAERFKTALGHKTETPAK